MEVEKIIILIIQIPTFLILFGLGYLVRKKQYYDLISGFSTKSKEEQEELINNGYPQAVGRVIENSSYILLVGLVLFLFNIPMAFLGSIVIMMVYMFIHLLFISKLDAKRVRKRNTIILAVTAVFTIGLIGVLVYIGEQPNELLVDEEKITISGVYGLEWNVEEITHVELVTEMPRILSKSNGFSHDKRAKGKFRLKDLGTGTLFIYRDHPPFIYVERGEDFIFINSNKPEETLVWYEALSQVYE